MIIDESLASYEGEQAATDQAGSDQAGSDQATADGQATADDWAAADAATEEATVAGPTTNPPAARDNLIVIVDDTAYDDTTLETGPGTEAVSASDDVIVSDYGAAPPDADVSAETRPATDVTMATGSGDTATHATQASLKARPPWRRRRFRGNAGRRGHLRRSSGLGSARSSSC